jgi:O-antigen/teichoic acid export membrane protein
MLSRLSTFKRGFLSTFGLDVVSRGLSAVATVLFIRALGVESFAYLILFLNVGQFTGSALTGGIRMRYMRVEAERVSRDDPRPTGFALAWGSSMVLVVSVAALCLAGATLAEVGDSSTDRLLFIGLAAGFTLGHASIELAMYHFQAHLRFIRGGVAGVSRNAAILAVAIAATAGLVEGGAAVAAWTVGGVVAVALVTCVPIALSTLGTRTLAGLRGDFGRESGWLTLYYLASAGFAYASMFVVASLLDDEAVASFGAALRYTAIVMGPAPALLAIIRIRTSQRDIVDSAQRQAAMLVGWVKRATLPVAGVLGVAALAAPLAIPLIDDGRYPDSIPVFQLLLIGALVNYATMPSANLLMSKRRYKLLAGVYAIAVAIQVAAVALAAELSGVVAVAATTSAVTAVEASFVAYLATRVAPLSAAADRVGAA